MEYSISFSILLEKTAVTSEYPTSYCVLKKDIKEERGEDGNYGSHAFMEIAKY